MLIFFLQISCFFSFFSSLPLKTLKNAYFDQRFGCTAPKHQSKNTTCKIQQSKNLSIFSRFMVIFQLKTLLDFKTRDVSSPDLDLRRGLKLSCWTLIQVRTNRTVTILLMGRVRTRAFYQVSDSGFYHVSDSGPEKSDYTHHSAHQ